jgi:PAS domain S-box-containing protein
VVNGSAWSGAELDRLGRALLETAPDAIVLADREGVIRFWNAGAERLFGFAAAEALGRSLDIIIPGPQRARHWEGYNRVMETGESRYGAGDVLAVPGLRKDGTRISLEFTVVPLHDPAGRMEGIAAILRDVTRRFEELRALRRQVAAAQGGGGPAEPAPPGTGHGRPAP